MRGKARWGNRIIEVGWLVVAAGLPLWFAPWGRNAFELPKVVLLWAAVAVMGSAWLAQRWTRASPGNRWLPWQFAVLLFSVVIILATVVSVNPLQSAQGSYDRMQGTVTLLSYLALFLLVADRLRRQEQVGRLLAAVTWASTPVVIYGLLQAVGWDPLAMQVEGSPAISSLGRSNFLGAYLVLILPLTLASACMARQRLGRVAYGLLLCGQLTCLLATTAQAAWLGALAAGGVLLLVVVWLRGHRRFVRIGLALGCAALVLGLIALVLARGLEGSLGARATIWRATWTLVAARPFLGYGPETFGLVFTHAFPPELVYVQGRAVLVDRAHNLILDALVSTGTVGLLAFVVLVATSLLVDLRRLAQTSERWVRIVLAGALAAVVGHLVETQFSFPVTTTAALFWLMLGMLVAPWSRPVREAASAPAGERRAIWLRRAFAALLLLAVVPASLAVLIADVSAGKAGRVDGDAGLDESIAAAQRATSLWPNQATYYQHLSWLHLQRAQRSASPWSDLQAAERALDGARKLTPDDYRIWAGYGELYLAWGRAGDPARFDQAESAYRHATTLFPGSAMLHTGWGLLYVAQDRLPEAAQQFDQAVALDHTDAWAFTYLGNVLLAQGEWAGAEQAYRNALRWGPDMPGAYRGLGQVYYHWGWPDAALRLFQSALELAPGDQDLYLEVARCHRDLGRQDLACQAAEQGLVFAPGHPGLEAFFADCGSWP
jgi:tetratricopeptide (TPR) repeat protein/O-antigen ligase